MPVFTTKMSFTVWSNQEAEEEGIFEITFMDIEVAAEWYDWMRPDYDFTWRNSSATALISRT